MQNYIHESVKKGANCEIGHFSVLMEKVELGDNVRIGNGVIIHPGTRIGSNVVVDDNTVLGKQPRVAPHSTLKKLGDITDSGGQPALVIGDETTVGACAVLYAGAVIGRQVMVADLASIRENCNIGDFVIVGRGVTIENHVNIGRYTKLQAEAYITAHSEVGERVFVAPTVSTTNDNFMGRTEERFKHRKGCTIKDRARIGGNSVLLPGVTVGEEGVVGAGSVVTRDVPAYKVVYGVPAKVVRKTPEEQVLVPEGEKA